MSAGWVEIGRRRPEACPSLARKGGIENVELEVFSDSAAAMWELYDFFGFSPRGGKIRGRKCEDCYQDVTPKALWL
jgi:hypothetical protein